MGKRRLLLLALVAGALVVTRLGASQIEHSSASKRQAAAAATQALHTMPVPGGEMGEDLDRLDAYWNQRITYPTGNFNPVVAARRDRPGREDQARRSRPVSRATSRDRKGLKSALVAEPEQLHRARPGARAHDRLHRLLRLRDDRGPHQLRSSSTRRRRRRAASSRTRQRRRRRLEDDELLLGGHHVDRHHRRSADRLDRHRLGDDRPEQPQHDLRRDGRPELRLVLDGQPGHPQVDRRAARTGRCSARTSSGRPTSSPRASSRSTTRSARCASTRTTARTSWPERRRASSSPTTAARTGPGRAPPTAFSDAAPGHHGPRADATWAAA